MRRDNESTDPRGRQHQGPKSAISFTHALIHGEAVRGILPASPHGEDLVLRRQLILETSLGRHESKTWAVVSSGINEGNSEESKKHEHGDLWSGGSNIP